MHFHEFHNGIFKKDFVISGIKYILLDQEILQSHNLKIQRFGNFINHSDKGMISGMSLSKSKLILVM